MCTRGTRLPVRCRLLRRSRRPVAAGRGHRRLRRWLVVTPEGVPAEDHQRDEEENGAERHGTPLDAEPPRLASPTVTASCSTASLGSAGRHSGTERLIGPVRSRAAASTGRARRHTSPPGPRTRIAACRTAPFCGAGRGDRRGGADGLTGTVAGSSRAVLPASRSSRTVLSTAPARRTTSRQCARTASYGAALSCVLGRRSGAEGLLATVSRSSRAELSPGRAQ